MNTAVCMQCGSLKSGALTDCPQCGFTPRVEAEMLNSLAMSEHYFSRGDLEAMGARIAAGLSVELDAGLCYRLRQALESLRSGDSWANEEIAALGRWFGIKPHSPD